MIIQLLAQQGITNLTEAENKIIDDLTYSYLQSRRGALIGGNIDVIADAILTHRGIDNDKSLVAAHDANELAIAEVSKQQSVIRRNKFINGNNKGTIYLNGAKNTSMRCREWFFANSVKASTEQCISDIEQLACNGFKFPTEKHVKDAMIVQIGVTNHYMQIKSLSYQTGFVINIVSASLCHTGDSLEVFDRTSALSIPVKHLPATLDNLIDIVCVIEHADTKYGHWHNDIVKDGYFVKIPDCFM